MSSNTEINILFIEPFFGGSHKQLIQTLTEALSFKFSTISLTPKKWPWRARCSALRISQLIPKEHCYTTIFCSSVLSLSELLGLRPDLHKLHKIIYFHENQLIYPKQEIKSRDFQYGYNQITSCLAADAVVFNSFYNMNTFLSNINKFIKLMPDHRPIQLREQIEPKCQVLYFPVNFNQIPVDMKNYDVLHIIWPHRWEYDKGPEEFFNIIFQLQDLNAQFMLSVIGETFKDVPEIFHKARDTLKDRILHWGYVESKEEYYKVLNMGHVVVSTAKHEFFGVAVLEAVYCGCVPLLPNDLVYPEIYNKQCLYKNLQEAVKTLKKFCDSPHKVKDIRNELKINFEQYSLETLVPKYVNLLKTGI